MNISIFKLGLCGIQHSAFLLAVLVTNYYQFCSLLAKVWTLNQKCRLQEKYLIFWLKGSLKISRLSKMPEQVKALVSKAEDMSLLHRTIVGTGRTDSPKSLSCAAVHNQFINKQTLRKNSLPLVWFWGSYEMQVGLALHLAKNNPPAPTSSVLRLQACFCCHYNKLQMSYTTINDSVFAPQQGVCK